MSSNAGMFSASTMRTGGNKAGLKGYELLDDRGGVLGSFFRLVHSSLEICEEGLAARALRPAPQGESRSGQIWLDLLTEASDLLSEFSVEPVRRTLAQIATQDGGPPGAASVEHATPLHSPQSAVLALEPLQEAVGALGFSPEGDPEEAVRVLVDSLPLNLKRELFCTQFRCPHCGKVTAQFVPLRLRTPPGAGSLLPRAPPSHCNEPMTLVAHPVIALPALQRKDGQFLGPIATLLSHVSPGNLQYCLTSLVTSRADSRSPRRRESYCVFVNIGNHSSSKVFALYAPRESSLRTKGDGKAGELTFLLSDKFKEYLRDDSVRGVSAAIGTARVLCYMDYARMRAAAQDQVAQQYDVVPPSPPPAQPRLEDPSRREDTASVSDSYSYEEEYSEPSRVTVEELPPAPTYSPAPRREKRESPPPQEQSQGCCAGCREGHCLLWTAIVILLVLIIILAILVGILFSRLSGTFETDYLLVRRLAVIGYDTMSGYRSDYNKAVYTGGQSLGQSLGQGGAGGEAESDTARTGARGGSSPPPYPSLVTRVELGAPEASGASGASPAQAASADSGSAPAQPGAWADAPLGVGPRPEANYSLFVRSGFFDHLFANNMTIVYPDTYFPELSVGKLTANSADIQDLNADNIVADYITFNMQLTQGSTGGERAVVRDWTVTNELRAGSQTEGGFALVANPQQVRVTEGINPPGLLVTGTAKATRGDFDTLTVTTLLDSQGQTNMQTAEVARSLTMLTNSNLAFRGTATMGHESNYLEVTGLGLRVNSPGEYAGSRVNVDNVNAINLDAQNASLGTATIGNFNASNIRAQSLNLGPAVGNPTITMQGSTGTASFTEVAASSVAATNSLTSQGTTSLATPTTAATMRVTGAMTAGTCNCGGGGGGTA